MTNDNAKPKLTLKPKAKENAVNLLKERGIEISENKNKESVQPPNQENTADQKALQEEKRKLYLKNLEYFTKKYPKCFTPKLQLLKIDIHKDLIEREKETMRISEIRMFLKTYTRDSEYRKLIVLDAERIDLEGTVSSKVQQQDVDKLSRRKAKHNQQKQKERQKEHTPA